MANFNQELAEAGVLARPLRPAPAELRAPASPSPAASQSAGRPVRRSEGVLGGYWIIQVSSRDEAIAWACKVPPVEDFTIEVRQVEGPEDFPAEVKTRLVISTNEVG